MSLFKVTFFIESHLPVKLPQTILSEHSVCPCLNLRLKSQFTLFNEKRHVVLYNTGTISSHFLSHPAWKIWMFYLNGAHNSMMQRNSKGTDFPPPCLKISSHFLALSAFPTSKVCQCFICLKNTPTLYSILLLC